MKKGFVSTVYLLVMFLVLLALIVLLLLYGKDIINLLLGWMESVSRGEMP